MGDSLMRQALRWLAHPVTVGAIVVMALNDHVLKAAFGTWWTGKLSDVAGMIFFPALLAVLLAAAARLLGVRLPRPELTAVAITGVGFAWVKTTWVGATTASAVLTAIAGHSVVLADATDLLALPALGIAAWAGLGAARGAGDVAKAGTANGAGRTRWAFSVAAVPLALLASVASGVSGDSDARVVVDDAGVWHGQVTNAYAYGGDAYYTYTDVGWELFLEDKSFDPPAVEYGPVEEQTEDCVPSDPSRCFRVLEGATGIEASTDGGRSWAVDWALSPNQVKTLEHAYGRPSESFVTHGVGVAETSNGFVVIAGNGTDGFVVRGTDGTWARVGLAGMDCCAGMRTADFDTVKDLPEVHAYPIGVLMGLGLSTLALPFLAAALRRGRRSRFNIAVSIFGVLVYVFGALFIVVVLQMNSSYAPLTRDEPGLDVVTFIPMGFMGVACVVGGMGMLGLWRRGAGRATLGIWLPGALIAGGAAQVAPNGLIWEALLGVLALSAAYAVYVPVARRQWVHFREPCAPSTRLDVTSH